ncbi:hypothetical protein EDC94DRAFT_585155 [Helicostylum pulchrum]|nr:hypothetical protein EDC94DRAFT_585155 [Helicostylum pulchrum]
MIKEVPGRIRDISIPGLQITGYKLADFMRKTTGDSTARVTKSFTYRKIQQEEMNGVLLKVLAQDGSSFNSVSKLIKKYLIFSNQHGNTFYLSPPKETKKELIKIYSDSLAGALKSSNIKKIKLAKKQYYSNKN